MEQRFQIDLRKIEGEFPCPSCVEVISPDDKSCVAYDILEVKMAEDNTIEEIIVQRKNCRSAIHLTGFDLLRSMNCRVAHRKTGSQCVRHVNE